MAHQLLTKEYWNSRSEIIQASVKGFNMLETLPRMLKEAYPDFKALSFGFCSKEDLFEWQSTGWRPIPVELFDVQEFNKSDIPSRFGLVEDGGLIRWNNNYLMVMGKDFRKALVKARNDNSEEQYRRSVADRKHVVEADPRREEMELHSESMLESSVLQPTESRELVKRGPGRPPKQ